MKLEVVLDPIYFTDDGIEHVLETLERTNEIQLRLVDKLLELGAEESARRADELRVRKTIAARDQFMQERIFRGGNERR